MTFEEQQDLVLRAQRARGEAIARLITTAWNATRRHFAQLRGAWRNAHARAALYALSDRTLKDIGLHRSQIDSMFR